MTLRRQLPSHSQARDLLNREFTDMTNKGKGLTPSVHFALCKRQLALIYEHKTDEFETKKIKNKLTMGVLPLCWKYKPHHIMPYSQPASRAVLSLAQFWCTQEILCMKHIRTFLIMCCLLLGQRFQPWPNNCAFSTGAQFWPVVYQLNECMLAQGNLLSQ